MDLRKVIKIGLPFSGSNAISQFFGENPQFYSRFGLKAHNGIDFARDQGTEIRAVCDGKVYWVNDNQDGYGIYVAQRSNDFLFEGRKVRLDIVYGHMLKANVVIGKEVKKDDILGYVDSTGFSTDNHLHLGVRLRDSNDNIINYNNGYFGYFDPFILFSEKPSWFAYWRWKEKTGQSIEEWEELPIDKKYGIDISEYEAMKILPILSLIWLLKKLGRYPTYQEFIALTVGRWGFDEVFKDKAGIWWKYYDKTTFNKRVREGLGL